MRNENRKVHFFNTRGSTHEELVIAYRLWLAKLPGRLISEGPSWVSDQRMAITIEEYPAKFEAELS
jgi:hypothetical protein